MSLPSIGLEKKSQVLAKAIPTLLLNLSMRFIAMKILLRVESRDFLVSPRKMASALLIGNFRINSFVLFFPLACITPTHFCIQKLIAPLS